MHIARPLHTTGYEVIQWQAHFVVARRHGVDALHVNRA